MGSELNNKYRTARLHDLTASPFTTPTVSVREVWVFIINRLSSRPKDFRIPVVEMATAGGNPLLKALDSAKTQSYHFKAIVIAGMGFFTDAYDLFVIGILTKLLGRIYYPPTPPLHGSSATPGVLPLNVLAAVNGTALCGTLAGQLFFGWAGDKFGRKKVYGITLLLMIIASLGQGLSLSDTPTSVISTLLFFRFWLGFGIGGDYPLSATIMSEYSNKRTRGAFVAAVFAMQGIGYLVAATVTIVITAIFNHEYYRQSFTAADPPGPGAFTRDLSTPHQADFVWRIVLMFGAVPAALTFYSRSKMPETARYTALIQKDQQRAAMDMESILHTHFDTRAEFTKAVQPQKIATEYELFSRQFVRRHGLEIIGTCLTWFLLDISFYSQSLTQSQIFTAVNWIPASTKMSGLEETFRTAKAQAIIALIGTIPGYWFTVVFVDRVGRKPIQLMGFFFMSLFLFVLAFEFYNFEYDKKSHAAFIIVYGLIFFFCNFGPNATTFIVPAELFPARLRSTCHGISAACGKAGAIVGTFGFLYASVDKKISNDKLPTGYHHWGIGYKWSFFLLAISAVVGFFVTLICIPETKGRSLEDLSGENDENAVTQGNVEKEVE